VAEKHLEFRILSQGKGMKLWLVESFKELEMCSYSVPTTVHGKEKAQLTTLHENGI
jgi:hypothetical protein